MDYACATREYKCLHAPDLPCLFDEVPCPLHIHFVVHLPCFFLLGRRLRAFLDLGGRGGVDYYLRFHFLEDVADGVWGGYVGIVVGRPLEAVFCGS